MKWISFKMVCWILPAFFLFSAQAQTGSTNIMSMTPTNPALPDVGPSLLRVFGALILVIGLFLGAAWMLRNWQRGGGQRGRTNRLSVLETRSLGGRHAIYVIGYDRERFLVASSPSGVNLLSHLASVTEEEAAAIPVSPNPSFAQALTQVLKGK